MASLSEMRAAEAGVMCDVKASTAEVILSKLLAASYVQQALYMPPACTTIWNMIAEDITRLAEENRFPDSIEGDLLPYLRHFFAELLVQNVAKHLKALEHSFLGPDYSLRRGKDALALVLLQDIMDLYVHHPQGKLRNFFGFWAQQDGTEDGNAAEQQQSGEGWQEVKRKGKGKQAQSDPPTPTPTRGDSSRQRASAGGGGRAPSFLATVAPEAASFRSMEMVEVELPSFKTPPNAKSKDQAFRRRETLKQRSFAFKIHVSVREQVKAYNPNEDTPRVVRLYHGTRSSSLQSFKDKGIRPPPVPNEFSCAAAFYVSNSIQQAFEHPMHVHPGAVKHKDPPSVIVFKVDTEVLHGQKKGPFGQFKTLWFRDDAEDFDLWLQFCIKNLNRQLVEHDYDIVIGPTCIPKTLGGGLPEKLSCDVGDGVQLTQIACCSRRAMNWMGSCVVKAYYEKRQPEPDKGTE